jgi:hypothetical protein
MNLKSIFIVLIISPSICLSEEKALSGKADAERDFKKSGLKIASYGGELCYSGYGLSKEEKKILKEKNPKSGPKYCSCDQIGFPKNVDRYVKDYNIKMLELSKEK